MLQTNVVLDLVMEYQTIRPQKDEAHQKRKMLPRRHGQSHCRYLWPLRRRNVRDFQKESQQQGLQFRLIFLENPFK